MVLVKMLYNLEEVLGEKSGIDGIKSSCVIVSFQF